MSVFNETPEPSNDVERLIVDLFRLEHTVYTITSGDNLSIAELMGHNTPYFGNGWWKVETSGFHIHAQVAAVRQVRFVREPSDHYAGQESLSIWLIGPNGESLLRCYFTNLYGDSNGDDKQPVAARFGKWDDLRSEYGGGQDDVAVLDGTIAAPAAAGRA